MALPCPACGADLREGARFCGGCGTPVAIPACPECGSRVETSDRFCVACGHPLGAASAPVATTPAASEREGERKQVTVLFADVKGSMDLAEALDAEDWAGVMKEFFRVLSEGVTRFGGTVDKFTGDGIMAIFGAPVSQEDHARRACHAALHLSSAVAAFAGGLQQTAGLDLHVRIGLNSGEVVVGGLGAEGGVDYTALGHTVGLAQRMESMAEPGQAYLTAHTARLVRAHFALRDLGPVSVKGSTSSCCAPTSASSTPTPAPEPSRRSPSGCSTSTPRSTTPSRSSSTSSRSPIPSGLLPVCHPKPGCVASSACCTVSPSAGARGTPSCSCWRT